jgi:type IV secretory pathway TrbD component
MGAERKPILCLALMCIAMASSMNLVTFCIAIGLWVVIHPALAGIAYLDPDMAGVFGRSRKYTAYIPAFTTPFRTDVGYRIAAEKKSWMVWRR